MTRLERINQRRKAQLKKIKFYTAIAIILAVTLYIVVRGTMDLTYDLFNVVVEAPTMGRVYANEREPRLTMTPKEVASWELFKQKAHELAPIFDFPVNLLISQAALESKRGQSKFAKERNNYFGFACYDEDPEKYCAYFDNPEQSILAYMSLIKKDYPEAYNARKDPEKMIELIKEGGYATDPEYVSKLISLPEWNEN